MSQFDPARRAAISAILGGATATGAAAMPQALPPSRPSQLPSVLDFIPTGLHAAVASGASTEDLTSYFQAAAVAANGGNARGRGSGGQIWVPNGSYRVTTVGIRDSVFVGESRDGTIVRAARAGKPDEFLFDAMLERDGRSVNTTGNGWICNMTLDAGRTGRSCLRTYGGGVSVSQLVLRGGAIGLSAGLPIWASFDGVYAVDNDIGFHSFAVKAGDNGTSTTFRNCWAHDSSRYGFHLTQLCYSSLINCAAQDSGIANFYIEGNANGTPAVYSLQLIGCGSEGRGAPFRFRKCRDLTVIAPRVITPDGRNPYLLFDDSAGSVRDFSVAAAPPSDFAMVRAINHGSGAGSILLDNSIASIDPSSAPAFTVLGGSINGVPGLHAGRINWPDPSGTAVARIEQTGGQPFLTIGSEQVRAAAFGLNGSMVIGAAPLRNAAAILRNGEVAVEVDPRGRGLVLRFKDGAGALHSVTLPTD